MPARPRPRNCATRSSRTILPEEAKEVALKELERLQQMPPSVAEYTMTRNYLDWLINLPWSKFTEDKLDLAAAGRLLDEQHFGLRKVKDRLLEFLAVIKLKQQFKGPILCLVGPPGVGKTSLGQKRGRGAGPQIRPHFPGRHARRGGNSRPPPHLCRRAARTHHSNACAASNPATRSSCWTSWTRSARIFAATRPRPCWRCWTRRRTTRSSTIILTFRTICRAFYS